MGWRFCIRRGKVSRLWWWKVIINRGFRGWKVSSSRRGQVASSCVGTRNGLDDLLTREKQEHQCCCCCCLHDCHRVSEPQHWLLSISSSSVRCHVTQFGPALILRSCEMIHGPTSHNDGRGHSQSEAYSLQAFVLIPKLLIKIV